jgi:hypothetical protein
MEDASNRDADLVYSTWGRRARCGSLDTMVYAIQHTHAADRDDARCGGAWIGCLHTAVLDFATMDDQTTKRESGRTNRRQFSLKWLLSVIAILAGLFAIAGEIHRDRQDADWERIAVVLETCKKQRALLALNLPGATPQAVVQLNRAIARLDSDIVVLQKDLDNFDKN